MKIISGYKDYYDYLSGIFGEDPKIVLDRRNFDKIPYPPNKEGEIVTYLICDFIVQGLYKAGKYYWGEALFDFATEDSLEQYKKGKTTTISIASLITRGQEWNKSQALVHVNPVPSKNKTNTKENCAILKTSGNSYLRYPVLKDVGIAAVLPPHNMYLLLSEWLAPKEDYVDTRTNDQRVTSQGFDLKTSFRNVK